MQYLTDTDIPNLVYVQDAKTDQHGYYYNGQWGARQWLADLDSDPEQNIKAQRHLHEAAITYLAPHLYPEAFIRFCNTRGLDPRDPQTVWSTEK